MPLSSSQAKQILSRILGEQGEPSRLETIGPRTPQEHPLPPRIPGTSDYSTEAREKRLAVLADQDIVCPHLTTPQNPEPDSLAGNVENYVGMAQIPVGVLGPLRINGTCASGDFYIPLATTEGALVASYHRGAQLVSHAGGCIAACLTESVARSPCFVFDTLASAGRFLADVLARVDELQEVISRTSQHCQLQDVKPVLLGKEVYLVIEYSTGDASGQNMVTLATDAICQHLLSVATVQPRTWFVEGNLSGDKKATMLAFTTARGKKAVAECCVPAKLVRRFLHTEPAQLVRYWQISVLGGIQSGSIGVHGHYANALAALFIACGQDVACVSEASVGVTRMDLTDAGDLYVSVSLPNLIVGTVGGGTHLPTAHECLSMVGCTGTGTARKFAEICVATVLAGEISIIGALAAGDFAKAHGVYGRRKKS